MDLRFDRHELAGSLGDLGTLLPLTLGLIVFNGVDATATFVGIGAFYVLSGLYFKVPVPVQPMKAIAAYALAESFDAARISTAGLCLSALLLLLALTKTTTSVQRLVPKPTVRGVQLVTGVLLIVQGIRFMLGETGLQQTYGTAEPFLALPSAGPIPWSLVIGVATIITILVLLENRVAPAGLVVVIGGVLLGLGLGGWRNLAGVEIGLHGPRLLPFGLPTLDDLALALTALALPQLPLTVGNAVVAQADLTREYFGDAAARRSTPRALTVSMGLANLGAGLCGGMPMCHGAGGLAAHYRFGARTAGSNVMIGALFLLAGLLLGKDTVAVFGLLPFSVLGGLLCVAGAQLALLIVDIDDRGDLFVVVVMLAVSLAAGLGAGFAVGIAAAYFLKLTRIAL
jgi:SulP family sulfate permease